ncbi:MAG TPA: TRAP transporter substrate-binding protein DctP [Alphaproteobacteria bacterium]|nr:TRAP transporter substrate-binding protein DctP [Alphaproteobacteria bacterium]
MRKTIWLAALAPLLMLISGQAGAAAAKTTLHLVHPLPKFLIFTKSCFQLVDKINKASGGAVEIKVRGGREVIPSFEQAPAVSKGVVDMSCLPITFYSVRVPELDAIPASNSSPAAVRANGGMKILDDLHQKYLGVKFLGWTDSGVPFHIFMKAKPKFKPGGMPDWSGVKLRDNPIYGAFFRAMGASTHAMPPPAVFQAMQKGVINASAWPSVSFVQTRWSKFIKYRLDPGFYQTDLVMIMNLKRWKGLGPKAQKVIQDTVIAHENSSRAARIAEMKAETALSVKKGLELVPVPAAARYQKLAVDEIYKRMEARLTKRKRPLTWAKELRAKFQK